MKRSGMLAETKDKSLLMIIRNANIKHREEKKTKNTHHRSSLGFPSAPMDDKDNSINYFIKIHVTVQTMCVQN